MRVEKSTISVGITSVLVLLAVNAATAADLWQTPSPAVNPSLVDLDATVLELALSGRNSEITIAVDDVAWVVEVESATSRRNGRRSLRGTIDGVDDAFFLLCSSADGATAAIFQLPGAGSFRLQWLDGAYHLLLLDPSDFEPCAGALEPPAWSGDRAPAAAHSPITRDPGDVANDGSRHDVLVAYTAETMDAAGGASYIEAEIQLAVDAANFIYGTSQISSSLRIVDLVLTEYDEDIVWNYEDHVAALANPGDGMMDELPVLRDRLGADFVSLFIESVDIFGDPTGACGVAYVMQSDNVNHDFEYLAYSVVSRRCASSVWTFAHEVGHNRGCAHNRENAGIAGAYPYAYGHRFTGDDGVDYRTVMSYDTDPPSITRIPIFSNPFMEYAGEPTGVPIGEPDESHCAHVHNQTSLVCAGFRDERTFVEFGWSGESDGFVYTPFATIAAAIAGSRIGGTIMLRGDDPSAIGSLVEPRVYGHDGAGSTVLGD